MRKQSIVKLLVGVMSVGMLTAMTGMSYQVYADTTSTDVVIDSSNFPDDTFRAYVSENIDTDKNGSLSQAERDEVTDVSVFSKQISSLKGIEYFSNLGRLYCGRNQLNSLDVSNNLKLWDLSCEENQLTSLDVSQNTALTHLDCSDNQLASLDVSKNTKLGQFSCSNNQLSSLDISHNTELYRLYCSNNQLKSLDVSKNVKLIGLGCSNNQLTSLDVSKNTELNESLYCENNQLTSLDISQNSKLRYLYCSYNQLTSLDLSKNSELLTVSCSNNQLTSLDTSNNSNLTTLKCSNNQLTDLNVSSNRALDSLECNDNQLASLNVGKNDKLRYLNCNRNPITSLDVSGATGLMSLFCNDGTKLMAVDLSNNANLVNFNRVFEFTVQLNEQYQVQLDGLKSVDLSRVSQLSGCTIDGTTITATSRSIRYVYDCGNGHVMVVKIKCESPYYTINFHGDGETSSTMENESVQVTGDYVLPANPYQREGYTFMGWGRFPRGEISGLIPYKEGQTVNFSNDESLIIDIYAQWIKNEGEWVLFFDWWKYRDNTGEIVTGWQEINGKWYYFNPNDEKFTWGGSKKGLMQTGWQLIGGSWYYFYESGAMAENTWVDGCYLGTSGAWIENPVPEGWKKSGNKWWYQFADGTYPVSKWAKIGGAWYYFDASGWMAIGWNFDGSNWYYLNSNGTMRSGWFKDGTTWYYLTASGAMATGWVSDGGTWYFMDGSGAMQTGWIQDGDNWYYMYESGAMAHDTVIDGCTLNSSGAWVQ